MEKLAGLRVVAFGAAKILNHVYSRAVPKGRLAILTCPFGPIVVHRQDDSIRTDYGNALA
ncbi:hypothetical protein PbJCM17693_08300 [Paenibacillus macerans]|nr:hypothetical protein PbJCM17693_08300 [Paenibacillus macerans]